MTKKLWQVDTHMNSLMEQYTSGEDVLLDQYLLEFDLYGSLAHATMLHKQGLILEQDLEEISQGLNEIFLLFNQGKFIVTLEDEDVHTKVESELTKMYPQAGAKLHTGRSRNDQVLLDIRLFSKQEIQKLALEILQLAEALSSQADKYQHVPLVGMTHMQPAMLSSFGLWLGSFAESLLDDLSLLEAAYLLNDQSPLGSGAAYGVTLPIDRAQTAELLGFSRVQNNSLYCQNSRGKIEAATIHALTQVMATLNKFATDCLLFTTEPFAFLTFDDSLATGSSIMPQKHNWDALELLRAKYHQVVAAQMQMSSSVASIPSGYNRDLQQSKGCLISAFSTTLQSVQIGRLYVESLKISETKVLQHLPKEIFSAHWAYVSMQEKSMPFREAYMYVKEHLSEIPAFPVHELLALATSQGSTGNLNLGPSNEKIRLERIHWLQKQTQFTQKLNNLLQKEI